MRSVTTAAVVACGTVLIFIFSTLGGGTPTVLAPLVFRIDCVTISGFSILFLSFFFVSRLLLFFYRLCGALPQNVSVGFVVLVVVVAVVSATESVGVDFYLYLRSLVQHYTSKVGSGLVWLAWLKCYLPDRLSDWQTDGQPDWQRCLPSSVSASDSAWAWLAGWLVGASLNRFLLRLSFRFVFISIYERKN